MQTNTRGVCCIRSESFLDGKVHPWRLRKILKGHMDTIFSCTKLADVLIPNIERGAGVCAGGGGREFRKGISGGY